MCLKLKFDIFTSFDEMEKKGGEVDQQGDCIIR